MPKRIPAKFGAHARGHHKTVVRTDRRRKQYVVIMMKYLTVALLTISTLSGAIPSERTSLALKIIGGIIILGLLVQLRNRWSMPAEVKLFFAFLLWAVVSSLMVAVDIELSFQTAWTVFQMALLMWAMAVAHQKHPDLRIIMAGLWGIGVLSVIVAYFNPSIAVRATSEERLSVLGANPNAVGQIFIFAMLAALYLAQRTTLLRTKVVLLSAIPVFAVFLMRTASRKMFIAAILLNVLWVLASVQLRALTVKKLFSILALMLAIGVMSVVALSSWQDSSMGTRWNDLRDPRRYEGPLGGRDELYKEGWDLFLTGNPFTGVGFFNQTAIMGEVHSDYMDVLVSTGIVGVVLYFSIYPVAIRRAWRIFRGNPKLLLLDWQAFRIYCLIIFWLMFGYSRYSDVFHLVVFGSFVGLFLGGKDSLLVRKRAPQNY
jgi:O-antigen ligase